MGIDPCSPWVVNFRIRKCYRVFCEHKTQPEAEVICRKYNSHLTTICHCKVNAFLGNMSTFQIVSISKMTWLNNFLDVVDYVLGIHSDFTSKCREVWMSVRS
ncbi:hypothetical protein V3C99_007425 [Haemonchus contortus]|uniref:C-type lectin domain-containing protein n=1 Tax=Haemonchus contortus TaxID=6289 RepID=A0A7I4YND6_HAECO